MKIFITGPDRADSFTHNVAWTFREMGHDVRTNPREQFGMQQAALGRGLDEVLSKASHRWRMRKDRQSVKIAREFKPDLTVTCTATPEPETVEAVREVSGGKVVCWFGDAAANLRRGHLVSGEYDAVFVKDPDFARRLRSILGLEAHLLVEACNPSWHRPVAEKQGEWMVVAGTAYGYRNALLSRLRGAGQEVRFHGPVPGGWVPRDVVEMHTGGFLDHETKAIAFGEAMACLNSFSPLEAVNSINARVFETCGCGGLMLSERRDAIDPYFDRGSEYLAFDSFDECLDHLRRMREDYAFAREIRARAARRAHAEHTYRHRLERMLRTLEMQ